MQRRCAQKLNTRQQLFCLTNKIYAKTKVFQMESRNFVVAVVAPFEYADAHFITHIKETVL